MSGSALPRTVTSVNSLAPARRLPARLREYLRRRRVREVLADLALWLFMAYPLPTLGEDPLWLRVLAAPLLAVAAPLSRRAPLAAAAVPAVLGLIATPELFTSTFSPALVALSFLLGRRTQDARASLLAAAALCAAGLVLALTLPGAGLWDWFTLVTTVLFAAVLPWLLGRFRRQQYALQSTGWELAARMEREQQLVAERTRLRERSRIASDMHDSLGHDLSLIAVRAAALQVSPGVDEAARASAAELRQAAADATESLRQIIGLLQQDTSDTARLRGTETVPDLVARTAASGVRITLRQHGTEEADWAGLPPLVARAAYRVVQEAVTNATKHAPGSAITVGLRRGSAALEVTVHNGVGTSGAPPTPGVGSGTGLISLDERVRQAGGTFRAHASDDAFEIRARLPLTHVTADPHPPDPPATGRSRSTEELAQARQRVRRGLANALWIPAAATAVLAVLMYGFQLYTSHESVLPQHTYEDLRVGEAKTSVTPRLPSYEFDEESRPSGAPPDPDHTNECRFYRTGTFSNSPLYRLCFADGRLAHKDRITLDRDER
ncbi:sensor histidine kinase [Streptomyces spirodelae]|uniref:histidine kinase n=1 Tax=Streptomyces spirodelae TaxID=2812904 RepID=A0ABS3X2B9_9ACTN|nr:histidine kinase [Streptomyces spirodelae]MBO8189535.1 sensor histidine kinase [Streptomyces spirodelae]